MSKENWEEDLLKVEKEISGNETRKRVVIGAFKEFRLSFDIEKHQDLLQRLVDTGEHFNDAHEMARMIEAIKDKLGLSPSERDKLLTATLLHDIGKSGPVFCSEGSPLRAKVKKLFPHGYIEKTTVFSDLVQAVGLANPENIANEFSTPSLVVSANIRVIDFWRLHVDWTYQILQAVGVDEEIVKIAASHHILEDKNPAGLTEAEINPSAKVLEATDKYQAFRYRILLVIFDQGQASLERGLKSHSETVVYLREKVAKSKLSPAAQAEFQKIISEVFEGAEKELSVRVTK